MNKELLKFVTALTVRRIAQVKVRSQFNMPDNSEAKNQNLYEIAGDLCKDFRDVFLQDAKELAITHANDKNLSPVKIALMLSESIPLKKSYIDVKDNFPETENIKRKLMTANCGHPANKVPNYFNLLHDSDKLDYYVPVDERSLPKPPDSDFSDLYEIIFKQAKNLLGNVNVSNFAEIIKEIIELLKTVPIEVESNIFQSMGSYLQAAIIIGSSAFNEIQKNGPGVMQSDKSKLWTLTKVEFNLIRDNTDSSSSLIDQEFVNRKLNSELISALKSDELLLDLHVVDSSRLNHVYVLHNKSFTEEIDKKLKPVVVHWQAQHLAYSGIAHVDLDTNDLSDFARHEKSFRESDKSSHSDAIQRFAKNAHKSFSINKSNKQTSKAKEQNKKSIQGILLIKEEQSPDNQIDRNKGLIQILFETSRYNHFWDQIASGLAQKYKMKLSVLVSSKGLILLRNNMTRLLNFTREFFTLHYNFGLSQTISASITTETGNSIENNILNCLQRFRDAKNLARPKIRSDVENENPYSGFKGSALSLGMMENASKAIIPSEDLKIFVEMLRQIASLAGYRVNHEDIVPLKDETKPEIFEALHEITNKMLTNKSFNWRPVLYYMLNEKMAEKVENDLEKHSEQAINNLLTTLRYNRWQNIPRLMSRPVFVYLNILSKWLRVLELK